jgi:hypothetical protein
MNHTKVNPPRTLKTFIINPKFQLKLLSYFIFLFFITTISLYSTTYLFFWRMKEKGLSVGIPENHVFYDFLIQQKSDLDTLFIWMAIFNFFALIGIGLLLSHRIAGPIYKLKNHLSQISTMQDDFKLRESDFFQELAPLVNELKKK